MNGLKPSQCSSVRWMDSWESQTVSVDVRRIDLTKHLPWIKSEIQEVEYPLRSLSPSKQVEEAQSEWRRHL